MAPSAHKPGWGGTVRLLGAAVFALLFRPADAQAPGPTCDLDNFANMIHRINSDCCAAGAGQCHSMPESCTPKCGAVLLPVIDTCGDMLSSMGMGADEGLYSLAAQCHTAVVAAYVDGCFADSSAWPNTPTGTTDGAWCLIQHVRTLEMNSETSTGASATPGGPTSGSGGGGGPCTCGVDATQFQQVVADNAQLRQDLVGVQQQMGTMAVTLQQLMIHGLAGITPTPTGDPPPPPAASGGGNGGQLAGQVTQQGLSIQSMQATIGSLTRTASENAAAIVGLQNAPKPTGGGSTGASPEGCRCSVCAPHWDSESGLPRPVFDPMDGNQFFPCAPWMQSTPCSCTETMDPAAGVAEDAEDTTHAQAFPVTLMSPPCCRHDWLGRVAVHQVVTSTGTDAYNQRQVVLRKGGRLEMHWQAMHNVMQCHADGSFITDDASSQVSFSTAIPLGSTGSTHDSP